MERERAWGEIKGEGACESGGGGRSEETEKRGGDGILRSLLIVATPYVYCGATVRGGNGLLASEKAP